MTSFRNKKPHRVGAFTLVEVVLALGITAFAFLTILSMIPAGLSTLSQAGRQIVETEIFDTFGAELNATRYEKIDDYQTSRFPTYFDNEGLEVPAEQAVFTVRCDAEPPELSGELRRVTISVGYHTDPDSEDNDPAQVKKMSFLLVD